MMAEEKDVNFLDLACLLKITSDTTLERFGSTINASVFDAANLSGSLKQKGLVDFTAYYPGPNSISVTDLGKKYKEEAEAGSTSPIDPLDDEILRQLSGGKRMPFELQNTLNIRSKDLALRIYKLYKQNLLSFEMKNGNVELMLTDQGFLKARTLPAVQPPQAAAAQGAAQAQQQAAEANNEIKQMAEEMKKVTGKRNVVVFVAMVLVALVVICLFLLNII